jgi:hypothetical protein
VGADAAHPTICSRCVADLHGAGGTRRFARARPRAVAPGALCLILDEIRRLRRAR